MRVHQSGLGGVDVGGLPVEVKMADAPISWGDPLPPINAEATHWDAVKKVRYLKKNDK